MAGKFSLEKENYIAFARQMAKKYDLPEDLFLGQLEQESQWNPKAVSRTGAKGIGQFQTQWHPLGTWKFKKKEDYFDPQKSIESAAMYMSSLRNQYNGNYMAALAHYNGGSKQGQLVAAGKTPDANETANYLPYIQKKAQKYQTPAQQTQQFVNQWGKNIVTEAQSQAQSKPVENPNKLTDQKQETIKSIRDYFTNTTQQTPETPQPRQSPYKVDPETQQRITELEAMLSQRQVQDAQAQMQALQHQQQMNEQTKKSARRQSLQGMSNALASFSSPYQSSRQPNLSYTQSNNLVPQVELPSYNPWSGFQQNGFN